MFFNNLRCLVDYGLLDTNSITSVFLCVVTNGNIKDTKTISTFATFGLFFLVVFSSFSCFLVFL